MSYVATTTTGTDTNNEAAIIDTGGSNDDDNDNNNESSSNNNDERQQQQLQRYQRIARYPFGTFLLDSIHLFSPWTWNGLAINRKMFVDSIFKSTWQSILGIFLPMALYQTAFVVTTLFHERISIMLLGSSSSSSSAKAITNQVTTAIASQNSALSATSAALSSSTSFMSFVSHFLSALLCGNSNNSIMPLPKQLLLVYLLSPWTISWLIRGVGPLVQVTWAVAMARLEHKRTRALSDAWHVLSLAIENGRAYRTRKYDVYLPPSLLISTTMTKSLDSVDARHTALDPPACVASVPALSSTTISNDRSHNNKQHQQLPQQLQQGESVIIFIPGSGLDPTGYALPAKMLSDCGHVVIVLSSEPLRMASPSLGFTSDYAKRLIHQVNHELNNASKKFIRHQHLPPNGESLGIAQPLETELQVTPPRERTFHLLGHSLGAFTASHWVQDLNTTKLVLWAALPVFSEYLNDLSHINNDKEDDNDNDDALQVLVLQASNDGIQQVMLETTSPDIMELRTKTFWQKLPHGRAARGYVEQRLLMGATHNGFGSHEAGYFLQRPEIQDMTRLQQQQQAVAMTHEFLMRQRP